MLMCHAKLLDIQNVNSLVEADAKSCHYCCSIRIFHIVLRLFNIIKEGFGTVYFYDKIQHNKSVSGG